MKHYAGLDVSQQTTSICIVDEDGRIVAERKAVTCPQAIATAIEPFHVARAGLETGPLSVWLWNGLNAAGVPVICMDARHANAALSMMPANTTLAEVWNALLIGSHRSVGIGLAEVAIFGQ